MPSRLASATLYLSLLGALASCSSAPPAPHDVLNENTGVTLNAVAQPLLFTRLSRDQGAAHDYVTLVAVEQDNAGKYTDVLLMYRWAISFNAEAPRPKSAAGELVIQADEHQIRLQPLAANPIDLSQSKTLFVPDKAAYVAYAYAADFETLGLIASSHDLKVSLPQDSPETPFLLWRDGRKALGQLVQQLTGS